MGATTEGQVERFSCQDDMASESVSAEALSQDGGVLPRCGFLLGGEQAEDGLTSRGQFAGVRRLFLRDARELSGEAVLTTASLELLSNLSIFFHDLYQHRW